MIRYLVTAPNNVDSSASVLMSLPSGDCVELLRVTVTLRLAVYRQSVRLGAKPLEPHDQRFFFSPEPLRSYSLCNIISDEGSRPRYIASGGTA
jgi:hypothetical protein